VLVRFGLRMVILVIFASFGGIGFGKSLAALLWMSAVLSAAVGILKREPSFDAALNHWDESAVYAALCCLISACNHAAPF
jgi:hypothetical protein